MPNVTTPQINELKGGFKGDVVLPGDGAYNLFRVNQNIKPA